MPVKLYDIVYSDPPWKYSFAVSNTRKIENHYPTMATKDICKLKVPAKKNSVLYLWATAPKLEDALAVMKAWGFKYKTHAVWDKCKLGMGYWFRGQHELLLVGVRGKMSPPAPEFRKSSVFKEARGKHSKKPDIVRQHIEEWTARIPNVTRLEMFSRQAREGWDVFGNEVDGVTLVDGEIEETPAAKLYRLLRKHSMSAALTHEELYEAIELAKLGYEEAEGLHLEVQ